MRRFVLSVLAVAACGGQPISRVAPARPTEPDAATPARELPGADGGATVIAPTKAASPFHLVARGYFPASLEKLSSGELLITHGTKIWSPKSDGSVGVFTQLEGPMLTPVEGLVGVLGPVVGEWPAPMWTSAVYGGPSPDAHPLRIEKGKIRPDRRRSFFPVVHRWSEGRLLAIRAQVELNNSDDVMWLGDRFEVVKGEPAVPPKVPKNLLFRGAHAFDDGRVVAVVVKDSRKVPERGAPSWLEWPARRLDATSAPLPDMTEMIEVNEVVGNRRGRAWVAGNELLGFEKRDGKEVRKERPYLVRHEDGRFTSVFTSANAPAANGHVHSLSAADNGALWLILDGVIFTIDDSGWHPVALPDDEQSALVARSVAVGVGGTVWVFAERAKEEHPGHSRCYVLSTRKPALVTDFDPEEPAGD